MEDRTDRVEVDRHDMTVTCIPDKAEEGRTDKAEGDKIDKAEKGKTDRAEEGK